MTRRDFLQLLLYGVGYFALDTHHAPNALASDDDGGGDDNGSDDNGGEDNSTDSDEDGNDDDYASEETEQDEALNARQSGNAMPTSDLIALLKKKLGGEVIDIRMVSEGQAAYDVKMINAAGRIGTVRVAAKTFKIISMTGF